MIARFPQPNSRPSSPPVVPGLALYDGVSRAEHEESLAWVRWLFQSVRAHGEGITFVTSGNAGRHVMIMDWEAYLSGAWKETVGPALVQAWRAAERDDVEAMLAINRRLHGDLPGDLAVQSLEAGHRLLKGTKGAKYQAVLGHLRMKAEEGGLDVHALVVWAAISVVFQMPVADMVGEYLREEWMTATGRHAHHADPQGLLSFAASAHRTLREAGVHELHEQR